MYKEILTTILNETNDTIIIVNIKGIINNINNCSEFSHGWGNTMLTGTSIFDQTHYSSDETISKTIKKRLKKLETVINSGLDISFKDSIYNSHFSHLFKPIKTKNNDIKKIIIYSKTTTDQKLKSRNEILLKKIESQKIYKKLLELSPAPMAIHINGTVKFVNQAALKLSGFKNKKSIIGKSFLDLVHPENREEIIKRTLNSLKNNSVLPPIEEKLINRQDEEIDVISQSFPFSYNGEKAVFVHSYNITEQKKAERDLEFRTNFEKLTTEITYNFINININDFENKIIQSLQLIGEFIEIDKCCIVLFQKDSFNHNLIYQWLKDNTGIETGLDYNKKLYNYPYFLKYLKKLLPISINNAGNFPSNAADEKKLFIKIGINSLALIPLIKDNITIGILSLSSGKEKKWTSATISLLQTLSEIFVNILERKKFDSTLNIYKNIVSSTHDRIAFLDSNCKFLVANNAFLKTFNKKENEIIGNSPKELFTNNQFGEMLQKHCELCNNGEEIETTIWFENLNKNFTLLDLSMTPFKEKLGDLTGMIMNARDITKQIQNEVELLNISEKVRKKIGMELHDGISQELIGIAIKSKILHDTLNKESPCHAEKAKEIENLINSKTAMIRDIAHGLFPLDIEDDNFNIHIKNIQKNLIEKQGITCHTETETVIIKDRDKIIHLYYIIQEAIQNIIKHSGAENVWIKLIQTNKMLTLTIKDDGCGIKNTDNLKNGIGLKIMRYRVSIINGSLSFLNTENRGTEITLSLLL